MNYRSRSWKFLLLTEVKANNMELLYTGHELLEEQKNLGNLGNVQQQENLNRNATDYKLCVTNFQPPRLSTMFLSPDHGTQVISSKMHGPVSGVYSML